MTFYVVKGAPDACGSGCDTWIEAEGKIEAGTAARFAAFLGRLRDRALPIYFASPGGNLDQAVAMGNMLHARHATARVGRSLVRECGFEAQDSEICLKLKQSGRELHGDLLTRNAVCASACPYVLAGAAVHEIAPDAVVGVHSSKTVFNFHGAHFDPSAVAAADRRSHERSDHMIASYFIRMDIDTGLLDLARSVKFEDLHILTREEIVHFGLDRREFVETPWRFENNGLAMMHKTTLTRRPGETSFRLLQWRVACLNEDRFVVEFQRPIPSAGSATVSVAHHGAMPVYFNGPAGKAAGVEHWSMWVIRSRLEALLNLPEIEFTETALAADSRLAPQTIKLSNEGWAGALETLAATCPPAKGRAVFSTAVPAAPAAK